MSEVVNGEIAHMGHAGIGQELRLVTRLRKLPCGHWLSELPDFLHLAFKSLRQPEVLHYPDSVGRLRGPYRCTTYHL